MKRYVLIHLVVALSASAVFAQCPWKIGEQMNFDVRALGIKAATQVVKVIGMTNINGRDAYIIWSEIKSTPMVDGIYKLRDTMTTYLDASNYNTIKYISKKFEGGWTDETYITNCLQSGVVWYYDKNGLVGQFQSKPPIVDLIGMIFFGRTLSMSDGAVYRFNIIDFRKMKAVESVVSEREKRKLSYLDRKAQKSLVKLKETGQNDMAVWFTDDSRKLPVQIITMKIKLGSLYLGNLESILVKYKEQ